MSRICIVTPHHVSFQPRPLREADLLAEAGHEVRVVCRQADAQRVQDDRRLAEAGGWRLQAVDLRRDTHPLRWLAAGAVERATGALHRLVPSERLAVRAYVRGYDALRRLVEEQRDDWYIAHTQGALPLAAAAATRWQSRLGFDCEDLLAEAGTDPAELVRGLERRYLARCDYVSVASRAMGRFLEEEYRIERPLVLYNVFPRALGSGAAPSSRARDGRIRLHWFGQTIGPGRGLEEAVRALRRLPGHVELHLRGRLAAGYGDVLASAAGADGVAGRIHYHPLVPHDELVRSMEHFDVGLALERADHGNYGRTVTNKLFAYLTAGLAVVATRTAGQAEVVDSLGEGAVSYEAGPEALCDALRPWLEDESALLAARTAAWAAARERYNWECESSKLLEALGQPN